MAVPKAMMRRVVLVQINTWGIFFSTYKHTHTHTHTHTLTLTHTHSNFLFTSHFGLLVVVLGLLIIVGLSLSYCKSGRPHRRISVPR
jgi:hypothetical protein